VIRTTTASDEETQDRAAALAAVLAPGDIVVLSGTLGAGKTTFVKGVARGLGVRERVTSPTFVLVRQHDCVNGRGITTLHHADVYRVGDLDEVWDLALGELVEESGVALVEWGELATAAWGPDHSTIDVVTGPDETRTWTVAGPLATRAPRPEGWEPC
jgi:tRNA threonylcarbamoyladenosine biosynthesis protein TsaE